MLQDRLRKWKFEVTASLELKKVYVVTVVNFGFIINVKVFQKLRQVCGVKWANEQSSIVL